MKRPLLDTIGRKLLIHLYKTATITLKKHNNRLVVIGYSSYGYQSKAEYKYRLNLSICPIGTINRKYNAVLLTVSNSELTINISGYGNKTLDIADKESIERITQFVQEACKTITVPISKKCY